MQNLILAVKIALILHLMAHPRELKVTAMMIGFAAEQVYVSIKVNALPAITHGMRRLTSVVMADVQRTGV